MRAVQTSYRQSLGERDRRAPADYHYLSGTRSDKHESAAANVASVHSACRPAPRSRTRSRSRIARALPRGARRVFPTL